MDWELNAKNVEQPGFARASRKTLKAYDGINNVFNLAYEICLGKCNML